MQERLNLYGSSEYTPCVKQSERAFTGLDRLRMKHYKVLSSRSCVVCRGSSGHKFDSGGLRDSG